MSGTRFVRYDPASGRIVAVGYCAVGDVALQRLDVEELLVIADDADDLTHYVVDGQLRERSAITAAWSSESVLADGSTEIVLSPLPSPCTVSVDGTEVIVSDGSLEFSTSAVGQYVVALDEAAYQPKEWVINAV